MSEEPDREFRDMTAEIDEMLADPDVAGKVARIRREMHSEDRLYRLFQTIAAETERQARIGRRIRWSVLGWNACMFVVLIWILFAGHGARWMFWPGLAMLAAVAVDILWTHRSTKQLQVVISNSIDHHTPEH